MEPIFFSASQYLVDLDRVTHVRSNEIDIILLVWHFGRVPVGGVALL